MINWDALRKDFPVTRDGIYFISAGMSPIPKCVFERIVAEYRDLNESGDLFWLEGLKKYAALKERIGRLINTSGDNISFVQNTSTTMSLIALALKHELRGDFNVVSMMDEFPATTVPFEYQQIRMKYVNPDNGRYPINSILKQIDESTIAVVTSHVQYSTGFRQDLEKLGRELKKRKILFIVNATQSFPLFHIDTESSNIAAMAASLHKWGFAGYIGSLFYTSPEFREKFRSPFAGWFSIEPDEGEYIYTKKNEKIRLKESADQYMFGTMNFNLINSFDASLGYLGKIGFENIRKRVFELADYLIEGLKKLKVKIASPIDSNDERSAILSLHLDQKTNECIKYLEKKKIYVSYRNGNMRIALNIFNNFSDIDRLLQEIKRFIGTA